MSLSAFLNLYRQVHYKYIKLISKIFQKKGCIKLLIQPKFYISK